MLRVVSVAGLGSIMLTALFCVAASADETGLASIHEWRVEGRKTCFVGHFHTGTTGGVKRSKKRAMRDAITSWEEFTAAEYGTDWARYRYAANRGATCDRSTSGWSCYVEGRPCNPKRRRASKK